MDLKHGVFTVSLDFELYWGIRDKRIIDQYKYNLQGVWEAIPKILRLFNDNGIHATWATVGFIFFKERKDLNKHIPKLLPKYNNKKLSPYNYIKETSALEARYHFAPELIKLILENDGQEIGTHTFSHYYCQEKGQSLAQFEEDIISAIEIAKNMGISIKSLAFPRNQLNSAYLPMLTNLEIQCYRGNQSSWMYKFSNGGRKNFLRRIFRLLDAYIDLSGHNTYNLNDCFQEKPFNFPASCFLRPYSDKLAFLDNLRLQRIRSSLDDASINNRIFHLWWHPHNFGINTNKNINFLANIVEYFNFLKKSRGMLSLNMGELCKIAEN